MRLPEIEKLHTKAVEELKLMQAGGGPNGFSAIVEVARVMAIAEVCAAIRMDLRALEILPPKSN